ncbi:hypothetical protein A3Q56_07355 [Intoshia linei]|uniref:Uncharacterized protein n=1 Tax=Intoshia linei TaxID=1819745 RepID=A0A177ASH9_9BILA|nr:hypothetical protein A3Q56_07355 [Intoshia linei]
MSIKVAKNIKSTIQNLENEFILLLTHKDLWSDQKNCYILSTYSINPNMDDYKNVDFPSLLNFFESTLPSDIRVVGIACNETIENLNIKYKFNILSCFITHAVAYFKKSQQYIFLNGSPILTNVDYITDDEISLNYIHLKGHFGKMNNGDINLKMKNSPIEPDNSNYLITEIKQGFLCRGPQRKRVENKCIYCLV